MTLAMPSSPEIKQWQPFPGAQTNFLATPAFEALFGGAAGPGKTECLVMDALRQIENPLYRAVIFRRTMRELDDADGPIQRSHEWYPALGGKWREGKKMWIFPSDARIYFHHMEHAEDRFSYQGAQYQYIAFDELTHFEEVQWLYMFSRCRTVVGSGLNCYMRAATNPGGLGHGWVKRRFIKRGISNRMGWFKKINEEDVEVPPGTPNARSRIFIPATLLDNPRITQDYVDNIMAMDEVERKRLLEGDWDAEYKEMIYDNFSDGNIKKEADYDPEYPVEWFADDGYKHFRVILFAQERPMFGHPDCLCIFDEYYDTNTMHDESIRECLARPYAEPDVVIYDPNALYLAQRLDDFSLPHMPGYNNVDEGIKGVRNYICDGNGVRLLYIHPRCKNLLRQLQEYRYKTSTMESSGDPKPVKDDDDGPDALRYGIATARMWDRWD